MAVGDVDYEENLIVEEFAVKADEDIELGEVLFNDGNGVLAASHSTTCRGPYFMACVTFDYSDPDLYGEIYEDYAIPCLVTGVGDTQSLTTKSNALVKGRYVEVSATAGEVQLLDYTSATGWYEISGIAWEAVATTTSHGMVLYGTFP